MAKQLIQYVSTSPGVGKTYSAIETIARNIEGRSQISMYVAPTKLLLSEIAEALRARLDERFHRKILMFVSDGSTSGTIQNSVNAFLTGDKDLEGKRARIRPEGCVLLLTHQGFMTMSEVSRCGEIQLFFDEARKCVAERQRIVLDSVDQSEAIASVCSKIEFLADASQFKRISAEPDAYKRLVRQNEKKNLRLDKSQLDKLKPYLRAASNPRLEVFFRYHRKGNKPSLNFFEVILPSRIFEGFQSVMLMSAFFEDSQMFNLLKSNKRVRLKNVTEEIENYETRQLEILSRYTRVDIVPLTSMTDSLRISDLNEGLLISRLRKDLVERLTDLGYTTRRSLNKMKKYVAEPHRYELDARERRALRLIQKNPDVFIMNPMDWYLSKSRGVIRAWKKNYHVHGKPLLILNKKQARAQSERQSSVDRWEILSTSVQGLNAYNDRNVVAFIAAINPSPALIEFYRHVMPDYDFQRDHVADVCIQCVCRTSVRDVDSKSRVLAIVPDMKTLGLLQERMMRRPNVYTKLQPPGEMGYLKSSKYRTVHGTSENITEYHKKWRKDPLNTRLAATNRKISRLRRRIPKFNDEVAAPLKLELEKMLKRREKIKRLKEKAS
jgi:Flavivirus DEAD domain